MKDVRPDGVEDCQTISRDTSVSNLTAENNNEQINASTRFRGGEIITHFTKYCIVGGTVANVTVKDRQCFSSKIQFNDAT